MDQAHSRMNPAEVCWIWENSDQASNIGKIGFSKKKELISILILFNTS